MKTMVLFILVASLFQPQEKKSYKMESVEAFATVLQNTPNVLLIDVRTQEEYEDNRIAGANFAPGIDALKPLVEAYEKSQEILIYCNEGYRSASASEILNSWGYYNVTNLEQGFIHWKKLGFPVDSTKIKYTKP